MIRLIWVVLGLLLPVKDYQFLKPLPVQAAVLAQTPSPTPPAPHPTPNPNPSPSPPESGSELLFADDFSQGLGQWQLARGAWSDWQVVDGWLQGTAANPFYITELTPKPEHWLAADHYQYQFDFQIISGQDQNWSFGCTDTHNWYEAHLFSGDLFLTKLSADLQVFNRQTEVSLQPNQTYQVKISFRQGRVKIWIDGQLVLDQYDYTYQPGLSRISVKTTSGASYPTQVRFDNVWVYSLSAPEQVDLPVASFKQTDDRWAEHIYNSATAWAVNPTIGRWGCALSSMAMVFDYFDLKHLPDGTELNPDSLNQWLQSQSDGYIQGAVNWLAGSRLTRLISDRFSTDQLLPKLEYRRITNPSQQDMLSILQHNRPPIVNIPGHFLVSRGYQLADQLELAIVDPAYDYSFLSEHQELVLSAGDYQPAQSDLSYFLLVYQPGLLVDLTDEQGQSLIGQQVVQDTVAEFGQDAGEFSSSQVFHYFPQPESGSYQLHVTPEEPGSFQFDTYLYNQQGQHQQLNRQEIALAAGSTSPGGQLSSHFSLDFNKQNMADNQLTTQQTADFTAFIDQLEQAKDLGQIPCSYIYHQLRSAAQLASELQPDEIAGRDRYRQLLIKYLSLYQPQLKQTVLAELTARLNQGQTSN